MKGVGKGSFPGVRRPIPGAETGGRASRCTHPGDELPPVCDSGPGIPESQTVKRLPPSSPGSPARPRPLPGAGPGVAEALLSDPAPLQRLEGRAGHRKSSRCPAEHKAESRVARSTSPTLRCRKKKKTNPFVTWRKRLGCSFSQIHRNYCIYPVHRSLVKINGCKLFLRLKKISLLADTHMHMNVRCTPYHFSQMTFITSI